MDRQEVMPPPTKKRRKPVTITRAMALQRIDKMLSLVLENVKIALHQEAALRTANMVVRSSVRSDRYLYGAECYHTIRNALALNLALTLSRLFDESGRRQVNKKNVASIPLLIRLLRQKRCRKVLAERAKGWIKNSPTQLADLDAAQCERDIDAASEAYDGLRRVPECRLARKRLKRFRNKMLAHNVMNVVIRALPEYRQLFMLMRSASMIVGHAKQALGDNEPLERFARERRRQAKAFWGPALTGAVAAAEPGIPVLKRSLTRTR
jgi:HEPN superfamily AbiU2-like protein